MSVETKIVSVQIDFSMNFTKSVLSATFDEKMLENSYRTENVFALNFETKIKMKS